MLPKSDFFIALNSKSEIRGYKSKYERKVAMYRLKLNVPLNNLIAKGRIFHKVFKVGEW